MLSKVTLCAAFTVQSFLLVSGCGNASEVNRTGVKMREPSKGLLSALIVFDEAGETKAIRIKDPGELASLESFFPNYWKRPSSNKAASWIKKYDVYFNYPKGETIRVMVSQNEDARYWSVGRGDFEVHGKFNDFVTALHKKTSNQ